MLKYMVFLTGALVILAATDEAQARGFRRSRGTCPNGQCNVSVPVDTKVALETASGADATIAAAPAAPAIPAPVAPAAPAAEVTVNVAASSAVAPATLRSALRIRLFRRR